MHEPIVPMNFLVLGVHVSGAKFIIQTSFGRNYAARRAIFHRTLAYLRCHNDALRLKKV